MKYAFLMSPIIGLSVSCATMNDSLKLGGGLGAATGAAATYSGHTAAGQSPSIGTVAIGAGVGAAVGLLTSYFIHKNADEDRAQCQADQTEMHFGDLPPSPFIVPKLPIKKGGAR